MNDTTSLTNTETASTCDSTCSCVDSCHCEVGTSVVAGAPTPVFHNSGACIVGWLSIVIVLCVGHLLRKMIVRLRKETEDLSTQLKDSSKQLGLLNNQVELLSASVADISKKVDTIVTQTKEPHSITRESDHPSTGDFTDSEVPVPSVRYATLQAPNESGELRFAERAMVETPSSEKMFILELDLNQGVGTYGINPGAESLILGDLQMFKDFVKPFSFGGNAYNATIKDKKKGSITREGSYWVVTERLEIIIN